MYETVLLVKNNYSSMLTICCLKIEVIVFCLKFQADLACYGWGREGNHCSSMIFVPLCRLYVLDILKAGKIEAVECLPEQK